MESSATIVKGTLSGLTQFLANESPSEMMKNAFYFTIKALSILKIFTFLYKNGLIRRTSLISNFDGLKVLYSLFLLHADLKAI